MCIHEGNIIYNVPSSDDCSSYFMISGEHVISSSLMTFPLLDILPLTHLYS